MDREPLREPKTSGTMGAPGAMMTWLFRPGRGSCGNAIVPDESALVYTAAGSETAGGSQMDQPEPVYQVGQAVRVVPGQPNHTSRRGTIREIIWHHKDRCFHYYIAEAGKRVSKRYKAEDLAADDIEPLAPNT